MKFSSPSSSSFDSRSNAAAGCLPGILRRILCGSLRSSNSREGEEADEIDAGFGREWKVEQRSMRSPGIVARLMGLEAMPVCPYAPASELIGRSRSTNSLESWPGFLSERSQSPPVRTSQSFREVPTYLRQENEDFLLLSFTPDDKEETMGSNGMRRGSRFREMKERKSEDGDRVKRETGSIEENKKKNRRDEHQHRRKKNVPRKTREEVEDSAVHARKKNVRRRGCQGTKAEDLIEPTEHMEMPIMLERSSIAKKKLQNAREKVESECSSQDSSPVSVLDLAYTDDDCCINDNSSPTLEEEKPTVQQSSRRKLSSNFENVSCLSPSIGFATVSKDGGMRSFDKESKRSRQPVQHCPDFSDAWGNICRRAEEDLKKSAWISKEMWTPEGVEDIAADLGLEIFDLLLCEVVCEFSNYNAL
ncbi:putative transcriptional regulator ATRX [Cocos nucifera]|uniref:Putative transcriptional regulator ATRX n=1 Tax=Cocos nucifera TaxID=13894 RepID=A0A8K0I712_COCNU|nr:putative transcriptional regulator ATRX [Cocos nucifera]